MLKILIIGIALLVLTPLVMGQDRIDPEYDAFRPKIYIPPPELAIRKVQVIINGLYDGKNPIQLVEHPKQLEAGFINYEVRQTDNEVYYIMSPKITPSRPPKNPLIVFEGASGDIYLHFVWYDMHDTCTIHIRYTIDSLNTIRFYPEMVEDRGFIELVVIKELPENSMWIQFDDNSKLFRRVKSEVEGIAEILTLDKGFYNGIDSMVNVKKGRNKTEHGWLLVMIPLTDEAREKLEALVEKYDIFHQSGGRGGSHECREPRNLVPLEMHFIDKLR